MFFLFLNKYFVSFCWFIINSFNNVGYNIWPEMLIDEFIYKWTNRLDTIQQKKIQINTIPEWFCQIWPIIIWVNIVTKKRVTHKSLSDYHTVSSVQFNHQISLGKPLSVLVFIHKYTFYDLFLIVHAHTCVQQTHMLHFEIHFHNCCCWYVCLSS